MIVIYVFVWRKVHLMEETQGEGAKSQVRFTQERSKIEKGDLVVGTAGMRNHQSTPDEACFICLMAAYQICIKGKIAEQVEQGTSLISPLN